MYEKINIALNLIKTRHLIVHAFSQCRISVSKPSQKPLQRLKKLYLRTLLFTVLQTFTGLWNFIVLCNLIKIYASDNLLPLEKS